MKHFKSLMLLSFLFVAIQLTAQDNSLVKNVPFTNIGPSVMSGRVVDIDVNPKQPSQFYVAYASGGLWYTKNNGTTFTPVLDSETTLNVGDIAVDWNSETIWVGTGENNSSRSSYAGVGILKSTDKGKTWNNVGLTDSHHIGRILINPSNTDEVLVAVLGHLYTPNNERGIYKTTDGGKTWQRTLFINETTGVIDIEASKYDFNIQYATAWERDRTAWNFNEGGKNSAIYKSTDAGASWALISTEKSGFPTGDGVGRIGLAVFNNDVVYALLDNQFRRKAEKKKKDEGLAKDDFKTISKANFLKLENKALDAFLKDNRFPKKHTASSVKKQVQNNELQPADLASFLEDANSIMFDSPVIGAEVYKSIDGGNTWKKTHTDYLDGMYSSYGYYFGEIRVNTADENSIYIMGVPILKSKDGGKSFSSIGKENVHSDHQALWVNPNLPGHLINGNDGGLNITYDDGDNWIKNNQPAVGQFYYVNVDNEKPYNVYGGLQDNGVWKGPSDYSPSKGWEGSGKYPYDRIGGGDGMQVQIDSRDANVVYAGSQYGNYFRVNLKTGKRIRINPKHELGETPYRFNWQSPILLSSHNQDIFYMGGNKLHRSFDRGETLEVISGDLTNGGKKGDVAYGTLTTISESPFQFGMIYTGSDDGLIYLTKDAGGSWNKISDNLPQDLWVSRVIASQHKKERVYASLNGYRNDDFKVYVYVSEDFGNTWKSIGTTIPNAPVNVIKEDPIDENMLYVGTDNGVYVSFDQGASFHAFDNGLTKAAVHDVVIQERDKDLIVGTHGRSIYKANIGSLQQYATVKNKDLAIFDIPQIRHSGRWGTSWSQWNDAFEPKETISFYSKTGGKKNVEIKNADGALLQTIAVDVVAGYNYVDYDLTLDEKLGQKANAKKKGAAFKKAENGKYYLPKGTYTIAIDTASKTFEIK